MNNSHEKVSRHSIRLKGYDYSRNGLYFITICAYEKRKIFGEISNSQMSLNQFGEIVKNEWEKTSVMRPGIRLHEYIIMPNHFHAIVEICNERQKLEPENYPDTMSKDFSMDNINVSEKSKILKKGTITINGPARKSLGAIVTGFKASVCRQINAIENTSRTNVWQRNYYEHIIRNEESYTKISEYIIYNAFKWNDDIYYKQ